MSNQEEVVTDGLLKFTGNFKNMLLQFISEEDPMLSMLKWLREQLMETEVTSKVNAAKSERISERSGYRSGYRVRRFDTRMGSLFVPKLRKGGYIPFFVTEKKRSEVALMNVIQEAVNGVSTRKIEKLAKSLGILNFSWPSISNHQGTKRSGGSLPKTSVEKDIFCPMG